MAARDALGLAEKAFCLVSRTSPISTQQDDAILLFSDRAVTRSSVTKNMGIYPLSEGLILIGRTDINRPIAAPREGQQSAENKNLVGLLGAKISRATETRYKSLYLAPMLGT